MKTPNHIFAHRLRSQAGLRSFIPALMAALCVISGTGLGADAAGPKKETKKEVKRSQTKSESEEKVLITGSLIPQKGQLNRIPVTTSPVLIIDQKDIQRSGGTTVAEVLRKQVSSR